MDGDHVIPNNRVYIIKYDASREEEMEHNDQPNDSISVHSFLVHLRFKIS